MNNNFGQIGQDNNPTGFTNNFLESRSYNNLFTHSYGDYKLNESKIQEGQNYSNILSTIIQDTPVSKIFFSSNNINHLKYLLCRIIKQKNNYELSPQAQSTKEFLIVMRSIYLQNAKHLDDKIKEQIIELNYAVLMDLYPRTVSNIQHYLSYIRDHGSRPLPMNHPKNVSRAGTKTYGNVSITDKFV